MKENNFNFRQRQQPVFLQHGEPVVAQPGARQRGPEFGSKEVFDHDQAELSHQVGPWQIFQSICKKLKILLLGELFLKTKYNFTHKLSGLVNRVWQIALPLSSHYAVDPFLGNQKSPYRNQVLNIEGVIEKWDLTFLLPYLEGPGRNATPD